MATDVILLEPDDILVSCRIPVRINYLLYLLHSKDCSNSHVCLLNLGKIRPQGVVVVIPVDL